MILKWNLGKLLLIFFEAIVGISSTTHWVVNDNDRIQSMPNSIFQIRQPNHLLSFLGQQQRRDFVYKLIQTMTTRRDVINKLLFDVNLAPNIESDLLTNDVDCLLSKRSNIKLDFYHSIVISGALREGITENDFDLDEVPSTEKNTVPDCKKTFPLDFSMHTFEHFPAMRERKQLTQHQENDLMRLISPNLDLNTFGYKVSYGLKRNHTSWLYLNLASIYWRIRGDSYNALECARRAIVKAPRQHRDIPLLTTAGILHAANHSMEAAMVLHTAIEYAPTESLHHLALANIYAQLGNYNKSIEYYDNSLKINAGLELARSAKHKILCTLRIENSLTNLHQLYLDIISEVRAYESEFTEFIQLERRIFWEKIKQMPFIAAQNEAYDNSFHSDLTNNGQFCMQKNEDESIFSCDFMFESQMIAQKLQIDFDAVENQAKQIRERIIKSKISNRA